jgi:hypothetical protein
MKELKTSVTHPAHDCEPMQYTQQGRPGVHARWSSKPLGVYLSDERVPNALQRRNKLVLKTCLELEGIARVEHREQVLENMAVLLSGDVREGLHRDVVLRALEPTDDLLSHLGLVLAIAERPGVSDDGLDGNRLKCTSPASPHRAPARAPTAS